MRQVQAEHKLWLSQMYSGQDPLFPAAGIVEESGELLHALLKREQQLTWGIEPRYKGVDWQAKMVDAVGDCAIYVCSYCNCKNIEWDFAKLCTAVPASGNKTILDRAGQLVRASVVFLEDRGWPKLYMYMSELRGISDELRIDMQTAVRTTWAEVKGRTR